MRNGASGMVKEPDSGGVKTNLDENQNAEHGISSFSQETVEDKSLHLKCSMSKEHLNNLENTSLCTISWKWPSERESPSKLPLPTLSLPIANTEEISDAIFKAPTPKSNTRNTSKSHSDPTVLAVQNTTPKHQKGNTIEIKKTTKKSVASASNPISPLPLSKPSKSKNKENSMILKTLASTNVETPQRSSLISKKSQPSNLLSGDKSKKPLPDSDINMGCPNLPQDSSNSSLLSPSATEALALENQALHDINNNPDKSDFDLGLDLSLPDLLNDSNFKPLDLSCFSSPGSMLRNQNTPTPEKAPENSASSIATSSRYQFRKRVQPVLVDESDEDGSVESIGSNDSATEWRVTNLLDQDPRETENQEEGSGSDEEDVVVTLPKAALRKKWQNKLKPPSTGETGSAATAKPRSVATAAESTESPWSSDPIIEAIRTPVPVPPIGETLLKPHEYFEYFFSDSLLEKTVEYTNIYSTVKSHGEKSINLSLSELKKFLGIWMYMGIVKLPNMRDYWASETRVTQVSDVMSYNRFQTIRTSLHFYDKSQEDTLDPTDRFAKVRLLLDHIREKCNELVQETHYSIDEAMVPYKGKFAGSLRQYIMSKPHKFGIKIFHLAGSNGIIYDFLPYAGSQTFKGILFSEEEDLMGVGAKIVIHLSRSIDNPSTKALFFDNYFASAKLVKHLKESMNLLSTGTLRSSRTDHCPLISDKVLKKSGRGSMDFKSREGVGITKWFDSKVVHMVSSLAGVEPQGKANRYDKNTRKPVEVPIPRVIQLYNSKMGGVDLNDMLVELHRTPTRARRWYLSLVGYMMDLACVNSWFLYKRHFKSLEEAEVSDEEEEDDEDNRQKEKILPCSKTFKLAISKYLMHQGTMSSVPTGPEVKRVIKAPRAARPSEAVRYDRVDHWPTYKMTQGRCKFCKTGFTSVCCAKCNEVNLCFVPTRQCFLKFHLPDMQ